MSATGLRSLMHLSGLVVAALLFVMLPFAPLINAAVAAAVWIMDGIAAEAVFRARASESDIIRDLRDRTDNPPS